MEIERTRIVQLQRATFSAPRRRSLRAAARHQQKNMYAASLIRF